MLAKRSHELRIKIHKGGLGSFFDLLLAYINLYGAVRHSSTPAILRSIAASALRTKAAPTRSLPSDLLASRPQGLSKLTQPSRSSLQLMQMIPDWTGLRSSTTALPVRQLTASSSPGFLSSVKRVFQTAG